MGIRCFAILKHQAVAFASQVVGEACRLRSDGLIVQQDPGDTIRAEQPTTAGVQEGAVGTAPPPDSSSDRYKMVTKLEDTHLKIGVLTAGICLLNETITALRQCFLWQLFWGVLLASLPKNY